MRSARARLYMGITLALTVCAPTGTAWAGGWDAPVQGCVTLLPYAQQYAGGVHRGIDLAAPAGAEVCAPAAGTVAFAGTVPADGGGTCYAATIQLADGLRVSLLPLDTLLVVEGDAVTPGSPVGRLAASGDDSSSTTHLHLGLRRGDAYLDPSGFLPALGGTASGNTVATAAGASVAAGLVPSVSTAPAAAPGVAGSPVSGQAAASIPTCVASPAALSAVDAVSPTVSSVSRVSELTWPLVGADVPQVSLLRPDLPGTVATRGTSVRWDMPQPALSAVLLVGIVAASVGLVQTRRTAAARVS